jgi:3-methyladenine DNA glycosylase AlkC
MDSRFRGNDGVGAGDARNHATDQRHAGERILKGDLLKQLGPETQAWLSRSLARSCPSFDARSFEAALSRCTADTLMRKAEQIASAIWTHLPHPFERAAEPLVGSFGPKLDGTEHFGFGVLRYLPHALLVRDRGLASFDAAMHVQQELTQRFTAEFSMRPFLAAEWRRTLDVLTRWASDPDPHVRRLVSECTRSRLPWATRVDALRNGPAEVVELLDALKDDPVRYVQRSVANNLADVLKDDRARGLAIHARWSTDAPDSRRWLLRHATRYLRRKSLATA